MRSIFSFALLATLAVPVIAKAGTVTTYDALNDFSTGANPNGNWTYGYGTAGSSFTKDSTSGSNYAGAAWDYWAPSDSGLPVVAKTNGNICCGSSPTVGSFTNALEMHPGSSTSQSDIVLFTATSTGYYDMSGFFTREDTSNGAGSGVDVSVWINGHEYASDFLGTTYGTTYNFSDNGFHLTAGQTVAFDVSETGNYSNDSTGFNGTLTLLPTPEPSSLALLGTGLLAVALLMRRKLAF